MGLYSEDKRYGAAPKTSAQRFVGFLEIENSHVEAVQFELGHISKTGFWFGFEEFDMERFSSVFQVRAIRACYT